MGTQPCKNNESRSQAIKQLGSHKTTFPLEFAEMAIKEFSFGGMLIFEPFAGAGTTLVAAENLVRACRAVEISPEYCAVILERMNTAFPELEIRRLEHHGQKEKT